MLQKQQQFDAQNAGNRISEFYISKSSGGMPPDPPKGKGALQPL